MRQLTGGIEEPRRTVVKPSHKEIRLDAIVTDAIATNQYSNLEGDAYTYNQKLGEENILQAKENADKASHLLEQAKENFYTLDKK